MEIRGAPAEWQLTSNNYFNIVFTRKLATYRYGICLVISLLAQCCGIPVIYALNSGLQHCPASYWRYRYHDDIQ